MGEAECHRQPDHRLELVHITEKAERAAEKVTDRTSQRASRLPGVSGADSNDSDPEREHQKVPGRQIGAGKPPDTERRDQA